MSGSGLGRDMWRRLPGWGAGETAGVGPGLQGPDYSQPRPPQAGEAPALLPTFQGVDSQVAADNRAAIKAGREAENDLRLPPYFPVFGVVTYQDTPVSNTVDLGKPNKGFRWLVRELAILPAGAVVDDATFTGIRAFWYVGRFPGNAVPPANEFRWSLLSNTATDFTVQDKFTDGSLVVQDQQHLYAYLTHGTVGYAYMVLAVVEQISDRVVSKALEV